MTRYYFNAPLGRLLRVAAFVVALQPAWLPAAGQGRIARMTRGNFLYSNWDAPHMTLDSRGACFEPLRERDTLHPFHDDALAHARHVVEAHGLKITIPPSMRQIETN